MDRQNAIYGSLRPQRDTESPIGVGIIVSPSYQGTEASGNSYFGISLEYSLLDGYTCDIRIDMGTATPKISHLSLGQYRTYDTSVAIPKIFMYTSNVKKVPHPRSFRVKVEGTGLDGQTKSTLLTIAQADINYVPVLD